MLHSQHTKVVGVFAQETIGKNFLQTLFEGIVHFSPQKEKSFRSDLSFYIQATPGDNLIVYKIPELGSANNTQFALSTHLMESGDVNLIFYENPKDDIKLDVAILVIDASNPRWISKMDVSFDGMLDRFRETPVKTKIFVLDNRQEENKNIDKYAEKIYLRDETTYLSELSNLSKRRKNDEVYIMRMDLNPDKKIEFRDEFLEKVLSIAPIFEKNKLNTIVQEFNEIKKGKIQNKDYSTADLKRIAHLKEQFIEQLSAVPRINRQSKQITEVVNLAKDLIDFQRTRIKFFETKKTKTRKIVDELMKPPRELSKERKLLQSFGRQL